MSGPLQTFRPDNIAVASIGATSRGLFDTVADAHSSHSAAYCSITQQLAGLITSAEAAVKPVVQCVDDGERFGQQ